jgi:hypothetical protein
LAVIRRTVVVSLVAVASWIKKNTFHNRDCLILVMILCLGVFPNYSHYFYYYFFGRFLVGIL